MNRRLLLAIFLLLPAELLERAAYYGARSILMPWLTGDLGMDFEAAAAVLRQTTTLTYGLPFLGALIAVGIGPRYTLVAAASVASVGFAMLSAAGSPELATTALVVIATGGGLMKACITAAIADAIPDPRETARNAVFVGFYLCINVASFVATLLAPMAFREDLAGLVFGASGILMVLATVLSLAFALAWSFLRDPFPAEPAGDDRWWRSGLGALALVALSIPYYLVIDQASTAPFRTGRSAEGVAMLLAWNPAFVTGTGVLLLAGLAVALVTGFRVRALLLVGTGFVVTALGGVPMLIAPHEWAAVAFSVAVTGAGECLAGPILLARTLSGHHWRAKAVFGAVGMGGVLLTNLAGSVVGRFPEADQAVVSKVVLAAAIAATGLAGLAIAAAHVPLSRFFWPEAPSPETAPEPSAPPAPAPV